MRQLCAVDVLTGTEPLEKLALLQEAAAATGVRGASLAALKQVVQLCYDKPT